MPRRNNNHIRDKSRRPRRQSPPPRTPSIDWELHDAERLGDPIEKRSTRRQVEQPTNEFQRNITGFTEQALEIMERYGLEGAAGFVAVRFTGVSQAPRKKIDYKKPTIVESRAGMVILTGVIEGDSVEEIGRGNGPIAQVNVPPLDSHDSPRRLNVSLGRIPEGFDGREMTRVMVEQGDSLILSAISEVNGHAIEPYGPKAESFWHGVVQQRSRYGMW